MAQLVLKNILAGSGNVLAGGDNAGNVTKVTIGSNLTLSGGVLSATGGGSGSVTSVAMTVPTGLSISGSPITTSGTLALSYASGYSIPTTASQTNWDTAYTNRITSASTPLSIASNAISISQATTSTNGYLSSTDWNTFNNKQSALTNPVTGTGTTNTLPKFTGTSTIGNSTISDTGSLVTIASSTYVSSGGLSIGNALGANIGLRLSKTITGGVSGYGMYSNGTVQSDVTSTAVVFQSIPSTQATTFTLANLRHFVAQISTVGAGSTITTQVGFLVSSAMTGATNNYGFQGALASATNTWNLYMSGTASNYLSGDTSIGTTTGGYKLNVSGTFNVSGASTFGSSVTATSIVKSGGTSSQFLKADGTVDSNTYLTTATAASTYLALTGGTLSGTLTATGFFESSDKRLKKQLEANYAPQNISDIQAYLYIKDGKEEVGYYAQEVLEAVPSAVSEGKDGFLTVAYNQVMVAKIQYLENKLKQLEHELGRNSK